MIKTTELRRGNFIKYLGKAPALQVLKVNEIRKEEIITIDKNGFTFGLFESHAEGIPLTPAILEAAEFTQHHDDCTNKIIYLKNIFAPPPFIWGVYPAEGTGYIVNKAKPISFVHELQNLYFTLTGDELNINL